MKPRVLVVLFLLAAVTTPAAEHYDEEMTVTAEPLKPDEIPTPRYIVDTYNAVREGARLYSEGTCWSRRGEVSSGRRHGPATSTCTVAAARPRASIGVSPGSALPQLRNPPMPSEATSRRSGPRSPRSTCPDWRTWSRPTR